MSGSSHNTTTTTTNNNNNNIPLMAFFKKHVVYKECRHNYAASLGKVSYDGCYEFLQPNFEEGELPEGEMAAFLCAVCNCHRSFHRRQLVYTPMSIADVETIVSHYHQQQQQPNYPESADVAVVGPAEVVSKKRKERTKFSAEQVRRMESFAEMLGWTLKRADKELIHSFCADVGVNREMFTSWMNNHRKRVLKNNNNNNNNAEDHHGGGDDLLVVVDDDDDDDGEHN